jgi:hypothetical protein
MKKLILILSLLLSTLVTFAQNSQPNYLRASLGSMGIRDNEASGVKEWLINGREVNILIELHHTKVIIHSKEEQSYYVVKLVEDLTYSNKWLCKDKEGKSCYIALKTDPKYPGLVNLSVEYDDLVWFYICTQE